ncbi:MAG: septation protein SpoVG family protein [Planctomycetaceae bacterium]|nr:SpoVG family protein [Planctomycetales bacterium]MCB9925831.1 septation protein SpoVG family protein [Planctomycetaceae bacterium]
MEITEVRIKLTEESDDRLQAFCSITFDNAFVVRDLKIIEGTNGPFVAMPSRKLTTHCNRCRSKNHIRARYCNQCGSKMGGESASRDQEGRAKLYADIAHPINSSCREMIQNRVVEEYRKERELSQRPDYVSRYEDDYDDVFVGSDFEDITVTKDDPPPKPKIDIQPSQAGPRPPHSSSNVDVPGQGRSKPGQTPHSGGQSKRSDFGAGILDE